MGQAKRRREALGAAYGTPEGSNAQERIDAAGLGSINRALADGVPVCLIGTKAAAGPLAAAAGLPWLHEIPAGSPVPTAVAWDWEEDPMPTPGQLDGGLMVLGAGSANLFNAPGSREHLTALAALAEARRAEA